MAKRSFVPLAFASGRSRKPGGVGNLGLLKMACIMLALCVVTAITSPAQTSIPLSSFDGTDGNNPTGLIQAADGNFYGTTAGGGNNNAGTVFQITPSGTLTTLYNFCSQPNCTDGSLPKGRLIQAADGNFYGTTLQGGNGSACTGGPCGTIFKITAEGILTTLYSFCSKPNCTDGAGPFAGLIQATDGNFYGTTAEGGIFSRGVNGGTVFEITPEGKLTMLHSFDGTDGSYPTGSLVQGTDGNFYGTTWIGGASSTYLGAGTVFKITPGGALTTLYSFCVQTNCPDGFNPFVLIQATDGNFYGMTGYGGISDDGTVFEITPSGVLTTLLSFSGADGAEPSSLQQAKNGRFYGTTSLGGAHGYGTVFVLTHAGLITLYSFCSQKDCLNGGFPGGLIQAADGNFYGTTAGGGAEGDGTVFTFGRPTVTFSSTSVTWQAWQALGETSEDKTVTLTNSSPITLEINRISATGNFAVAATTCGATLVGGKKCSVSLTFTPTVLGRQTGTLSFRDDGVGSPQKVALSGTGVEPATLTPASAGYGKQAVGTTSQAKTFSLTNTQRVTLTNIAISTTGDFAVSATTCTASLAAKEKCTISVTFTPTQTGTRTEELSVSDSASNSPQTSTLKGTGTSD